MSAARTIEEVCDLVTDGTHYTPKDVGQGIPFLTVKDVTDKNLDFVGCSFISEDDYLIARAGNSAPQVGDVLFSKDGTVGKVHVVETRKAFAVLSSLAILRPKRDAVDPKYFGHVLRSPAVLDDALKRKTGSAIRRVILSDLKKVRIPLPRLSDQRRIAEILDKADALRAKRRATLAAISTLTQAIFLEMFGDPARNSKAWPVKAIGEVAGLQGGLQVTSARKSLPNEVPYLRVANVYRGYLDLDEIKTIRATDAEIERTLLAKDDLLVVEGHGNAAEIGRAALWDGSIPRCIHQNHLIRVRLDRQSVEPVYACHYLNSPGGRSHLLRAGKTTSGLNTISVSDVRAVPIAVPSRTAQKRFVQTVAKLGLALERQRTSLEKMDTLFRSLQHCAFRGEL